MPICLLFNLRKELLTECEAGLNLDTFQIVLITPILANFIIGTIHLFVTLHYRKNVFIILINKKLSSQL